MHSIAKHSTQHQPGLPEVIAWVVFLRFAGIFSKIARNSADNAVILIRATDKPLS